MMSCPCLTRVPIPVALPSGATAGPGFAADDASKNHPFGAPPTVVTVHSALKPATEEPTTVTFCPTVNGWFADPFETVNRIVNGPAPVTVIAEMPRCDSLTGVVPPNAVVTLFWTSWM